MSESRISRMILGQVFEKHVSVSGKFIGCYLLPVYMHAADDVWIYHQLLHMAVVSRVFSALPRHNTLMQRQLAQVHIAVSRIIYAGYQANAVETNLLDIQQLCVDNWHVNTLVPDVLVSRVSAVRAVLQRSRRG